jgi:dTDP-4-dehydrorhamnose reductase
MGHKNSVLILGARGNLGTCLMNTFQDLRPIGWDREELDITDANKVTTKISLIDPELIINASAYNAVDKCEENKKEFALANKINGEAPGYLAKVAKDLSCRLIHFSTDYVFPGTKKTGYKESDRPAPIQNYGKSKLLGEKEISESMTDFYLIRTSKLFGKAGASPLTKKSFVDIMLDLAKEKKEISVVNEEFSSFTYTFDLSLATRLLADGLNGKKFPNGIYHLVNEGPCTWYKCAQKIFQIAKKTVTVKPVSSSEFPRPAKRPAYSALLNTKFPKLRSLDEALKDYLSVN